MRISMLRLHTAVLACMFSLCVHVADPCAAVVSIEWDQNSEQDLSGYKVYFGLARGEYDYSLNVGGKTQVYVSGLEEGLTYHFAVTAFDLSGNESPFSREVTATIPESGFFLLDLFRELFLSLGDILYEFTTYNPGSSLLLEDSLLGILVEIPPGATTRPLPMGIGSSGTDVYQSSAQVMSASVAFEVVPGDLSLMRPALISVPFDGPYPAVERYDETSHRWLPVEDVQSMDSTVCFSTYSLGRFRVFSLREAQTGPAQGNRSSSRSEWIENQEENHAGGQDQETSPESSSGGGCFLSSCMPDTDC
jgi:hypothetical protein